MRRLAILTFALSCLALPASDDCKPAFFDGKTTAGWEGKGELWRIVDGAIVGSTEPDGLKGSNTFLCTQKKYRDFEMKCKVRLKDGKGNSGIQIRSEMADPKGFVVKGPQADMGQQYWGSLYGEKFGGMMKQSPADKVKAVVKQSDFNDYWVKVVGKRVTITINGTVMVDEEFKNLPDEGIIALQLHAGGPMEVTFKNIEFKEIK
ncbi:MAG: DUF1080 domain-containing protein [Gemmataceae bacterium]